MRSYKEFENVEAITTIVETVTIDFETEKGTNVETSQQRSLILT